MASVRAPDRQYVDRLIDDGAKKQVAPATATGHWPKSKDVSYSEYVVTDGNVVKFKLTADQRKWMENSFYGDFKSSLGFTRWWYAVKDDRGRPTQRAMRQWYNAQEVNQMYKPVKFPKTVVPIRARKKWRFMQADAISLGKFSAHGYKYIYNVIDGYTKKAFSTPFEDMTAANARAAFHDVMLAVQKNMGAATPSDMPHVRLTVDNGPETSDRVFVKPLREAWPTLTVVKAKSYSPNTQGQVEKFNSTLQRAMSKRHYVSGFPKRKKQFPPWVAELVRIYNESASEPNDYAAPNLLASMSDKEISERETQRADRSPKKKRVADVDKSMARRAPQLLKVGTRVRIVSRKWKKAATSLRGNLKYRPKASDELYTVVRHARRVLDRPLRVYLEDQGGETVAGSFSIDELVIANDSDPAPGLAERTRNEGDSRGRIVSKMPLPDYYTGKRLLVFWNDDMPRAPAVVGAMYKSGVKKYMHRVRFDDDPGREYTYNLAGYGTWEKERVEGEDYVFE